MSRLVVAALLAISTTAHATPRKAAVMTKEEIQKLVDTAETIANVALDRAPDGGTRITFGSGGAGVGGTASTGSTGSYTGDVSPRDLRFNALFAAAIGGLLAARGAK